MSIEYRSLNDLSACIRGALHRIPTDIDLIVGVPRSGLLAANMMALHLNLPLADLDSFLEGRVLSSGFRFRDSHQFPKYQRALVLDDSVATGNQINEIRDRLERQGLRERCLLGAVYMAPGKESLVDLYLETVPEPRMFEWNFMAHYLLPTACVDIDGVLCRDPTEAENDDGLAYERFLAEVEPLFRPRRKIGWLVTSRLEKYRQLTEDWLGKHDIEYDQLMMLDLPSKKARQEQKAHGTFKASVFTTTKSSVFIESTQWQAEVIASRAGKPVLSIEGQQMINPGEWQVQRARVTRAPILLVQRLGRALRWQSS